MTPSIDRHHNVFLYQLFTWFGRGAYLIAFTSILHHELTISPLLEKQQEEIIGVQFPFTTETEKTPLPVLSKIRATIQKRFSQGCVSADPFPYTPETNKCSVDMRITSLVHLLLNVLHYIIKVLLCYLLHKSAFLAVRFSI